MELFHLHLPSLILLTRPKRRRFMTNLTIKPVKSAKARSLGMASLGMVKATIVGSLAGLGVGLSPASCDAGAF
jgi:hypothetical protein